MRYIKLCIILLMASISFGQEYTEIGDLEFNEITPIWSRVVVDSTQIIEDVSNGTDQLRTSALELIIDDRLIHIYIMNNATDWIGYYIECIHIDTGDQLWTYTYDDTVDNHKEVPLSYDLQDGILKVYGYRALVDSNYGETELLFNAPGNLVLTGFDITTGNIVYKIINDDDPNDINFSLVNFFGRNYYIGDKEGGNYLITANHFSDTLRMYNVDDFGSTQQVLSTKVLDGRPERFRASISRPYNIDNYYIGSIGVYDYDNPGENTQNYFYRIDEDFKLDTLLDIKEHLTIPEAQHIAFHNEDFVVLSTAFNEDYPTGRNDLEYLYIKMEDMSMIKYDLSSSDYGYTRSDVVVNEEGVIIVVAEPIESDDLHIFSAYGNQNLQLNKILTPIYGPNDILFLENILLVENDKLLVNLVQALRGESFYVLGNWNKQFLIDLKDLDVVSDVETIDISDNMVRIYPNPTSNYLDVDLSAYSQEYVQIELFNPKGAQVFSREISGQETSLRVDMSQMPTGIYSLKISSKDKTFTQQVVKI